MKDVSALEELRQQIDSVDSDILCLLNKRADLVIRIQKIKKSQGIHPYSSSRENEIIERLKKANNGPLSDEVIGEIFSCIMKYLFSSLRMHDEQ